MTSFIASLILASNVAQVPVDQVLSQRLYVVPTAVEVTLNDEEKLQDTNELRIAQHRRDVARRPQVTGDQEFPTIAARSAIVMDVETGVTLWQKNPDSQIPIASITKLANVLTWQRLYDGEFDAKVAFTAADKRTIAGSKDLLLPEGNRLTVEDLLEATLVGSYNDAAQALARSTGRTREEFVDEMRVTAQRIGMRDTTFEDVTGLGERNMSTARDVALLASEAARRTRLQELMSQPSTEITVLPADYSVSIDNTDELLSDGALTVLGGKTGYTDEAGYCFVAIVEEPVSRRRVAIAVLGSGTEEGRFQDTKTLAQWAFGHFSWPQ